MAIRATKFLDLINVCRSAPTFTVWLLVPTPCSRPVPRLPTLKSQWSYTWGSHLKNTALWFLKIGSGSQSVVFATTRRYLVPPTPSENSIKSFVLTTNTVPWRMSVSSPTTILISPAVRNSLVLGPRISTTLFFMKSPTCGLVTSSLWSGGMTFGWMSLLQTWFRLCAWTKLKVLKTSPSLGQTSSQSSSGD